METKLPCDKHGEQIKTLFKQVEEFKSLQDIIYNLDKNTAVLAQTMKEMASHSKKQDKRIDEQHQTIVKINENLTQLTESQRMLNEGQNELNSKIKILKKRVDENEEIIPNWEKPLYAEVGYSEGDKVIFEDEIWISTVNKNVWSPAEYGWELWEN